MQQIYLILTNTDTTLSKMIKTYLKYPYNHVSISLDRDLNNMYSFGRIEPKNPFVGGFVHEDILNGTYAKFPQTSCKIFELNITDLEYLRIKERIDEFENEKQLYGYNVIGLLGIMVNKPIKSENTYVCSEFVSETLFHAGIHLFDKQPQLITPMDFEILNNHIIYEGNLRDYYLENIKSFEQNNIIDIEKRFFERVTYKIHRVNFHVGTTFKYVNDLRKRPIYVEKYENSV